MDYNTLERISKLIDDYTRNANAYYSHMKYVVEVQSRDSISGMEMKGMNEARANAMQAFNEANDIHAKIFELID